MTDNEKFARWQGWQPHPNGKWHRDEFNIWKAGRDLPDYSTDSAACMSLLDTLVERGWEYSLFGNQNRMNKVDFRIYKDDVGISMAIKPTINEAITAACLEVIERERANGKD